MHPDSPQKQIWESKTETPQQWVLYLLFPYIVISRAYLKFSIFPLIKTHIHTPCISIQAMKPPKTRHPGISPLGWSSTKDMTRTTPSRPASHPVCLWQYSFQHTTQEISSFKEENSLYISAKTLGSSTEQKTEVQSRLGLLPWFREGDLRKGAQCSPRYGGISLTCCLFSFQPIPLDSLVPLLGQLVLPFWPRNLHPFLYLGQNIIHLMVEFNQWYVHLCDYSSLPSTQSSVSSLLFIASIGRTFHLPHFAHFLLPHLQLWRLSWHSCLSWRILLSACHSLLFSS